MKKTTRKSWMKMTSGELAEATKQFDQPVNLRETRPLSAKNRKWWNRAKRGGRPKVGKGAKPVLITVERGLLKRIDSFAKKAGLSRSQLFASGIIALMRKKAG